MIFKYNFEINLQDINNNKEIKNKSLLQALENISSKHSDSIKNGVSDIIDKGETWVLLDWKMQVLDRPKYGDVLEIHTWTRNSTRLYTYRDFEIYVNGERKVIASAKWLLVDSKTFRPIKLTEDVMLKYQPELEKNVFNELEIEKLKELDEYNNEINYLIRKSDIDINNHVHNLNYIDMAYEILDDAKEFNNVRISYKKEIKYEDKIKVESNIIDKKYYFVIKNIENNITHSLIEMF